MGFKSTSQSRRDFRLLLFAAALPAIPAAAATPAPKPVARPVVQAPTAKLAKATPAEPTPAPVVSLAFTAPSVLDGPKSRQQLLVTGTRADGSQVDLTSTAVYASKTPKIAVVNVAGVVQPIGDGVATILARAEGKAATAQVTVKNTKVPFTWNFENHVISVMSKTGCNMGACHGAAAGKNGFRLTLRGYDPELDYDRLLHESAGRRLTKSDPGNSLFLKKAALQVPHAGGMRFKTSSLEYRVVAEWIASGMPGPAEKDPKITKLDVLPAERILAPKGNQQLVVRATFNDGHVEDVTHWARYTSNEEGIATVDEGGRVATAGVGETAITVFYLGKVAFSRMTVPFPNQVVAKTYQTTPRHNYVDNLVLAKLEKLRILPSDMATDEEFLRRAYLDAIGTLPAPTEVRAFLSDKSSDKRTRLITELLERPEYVDFWTYKWGDLLRINRETMTEKGMWAFYQWLQQSVADNKPWDRLVYEVITANGSNFSDGPSNFYRTSRTPEDLTETVSQAFLGIRVQCAKCHNHPFEKWTQSDYYKFANLFSRVNRKAGDYPSDLVITAANGGEIAFPKTGKPLLPTPYDGQPMALDAKNDRRVYLADWLASPKNEYFVRSIVNRVWRHYMGRGLIEPVDDLRATNPASNEPLMAALSKDLVDHKFDLKHLMRQIMLSRTYQLTSRPRPENKRDDRQYSRYFVKRLTAEQLLDGICSVTGQGEKFNGLPMGFRAIQLPDTKVNNYFLDVFGRPPRQITCDCERAQEPNMAQALHLINGAGVNQKISAQGGLVDKLIKAGKKDNEAVEEMYLTCFGRFPTKQEMEAALAAIDEAVNPKPVVAPVVAPAAPTVAPAVPAKPTDPKAALPAGTKPAPVDPKAAKPLLKVDPKAAPAKPMLKTDPKAAPVKPAVKGEAVKPLVAKPVVAKPADVKPTEVKSTVPAAPPATAVAAKQADMKPADAKPAEAPKVDPAVARRQVYEDLLWALINGKEFVFNH